MVITLVLSACALLPAHSLGNTLPTSAAGITFDSLDRVDDAFMSGHAIDEVLAQLGKDRGSARAYFRTSSETGDVVGAVQVDDVGGADLLRAVTDAWLSVSIVARSETSIGDRAATVLVSRTGTTTAAYQKGDVVYLVMARSLEIISQIVVEGMP